MESFVPRLVSWFLVFTTFDEWIETIVCIHVQSPNAIAIWRFAHTQNVPFSNGYNDFWYLKIVLLNHNSGMKYYLRYCKKPFLLSHSFWKLLCEWNSYNTLYKSRNICGKLSLQKLFELLPNRCGSLEVARTLSFLSLTIIHSSQEGKHGPPSALCITRQELIVYTFLYVPIKIWYVRNLKRKVLKTPCDEVILSPLCSQERLNFVWRVSPKRLGHAESLVNHFSSWIE